MTRMLIATTNRGKLAEFAEALASASIEVVGLDAIPDAPKVDETGVTFEANARLKAETYSKLTALPVVADDSGLEVDAMDGRPGVYSARFGSPDLSDPARCKALLKGLVDVPDERRTARFRCVLALAKGGHTLTTFEGTAEGTILRELRGKEGFGYDPVFFHAGAGKTFAELPREEKRRWSHRGQAIARLVEAVKAGMLRGV
jgi:XTP/dITP diphosphohydrolase